MADLSKFPIDLKKFKNISLDHNAKQLSAEQKADLKSNIQLLRDAIVLFTATGSARGVGGHTGGAYDTVPEVCTLLGLFNNKAFNTVPIVFDEAGHRVATQYMLSALEGALPAEHLLFYRAANSKLPGHPELGLTPGVKFSSGRLGHMWPLVNGVAMANPEATVFMLGSDGSQQEGNNAEAARLAVARGLNVKLLIDDNNVTIAGHPSEYLGGYSVEKTLEGHGLKVITVDGEDVDSLWSGVITAITTKGPVAVVSKRKMAPGIPGLEGTAHAHDAISVKPGIAYLKHRGFGQEVWGLLEAIQPTPDPIMYVGSTKERGACRVEFGEAVSNVLAKLDAEKKKNVMVIDSDLEGSTGLKVIHQKHPDVFVSSGIMERGNYSAAAGFGFDGEKQGVFSTFSAFLEMVISEITMARLNNCNVLSHFSHSGVDEMCDNTCHFGLNSFFADNGLADAAVPTRLYFPADPTQMHAIINKVFFDKGLRFVFSTRSKTPYLLKENSEERVHGDNYEFVPGKDEFIAEGKDGYVVTYGEMTYRAWDAVLRCRRDGTDVGLVNKATLNVADEEALRKIGSTGFVLVVESMNQSTGLGSRFGTWLLERQLTPKYGYIGTNKEGCGGMWEQIPHQGLDPQSIILKIKQLSQK